MFKYSCFIRKNTPELREKLQELGYDINSIKEDSECIATAYVNSTAIGIKEESFDDTNPHRTWNCAGRIDCKYNEELFLAIAALRNDTDKNQWFVHNNNVFGDSGWEICEEDKFERIFFLGIVGDEEYYTDDTKKYHKATVEELIEHFNEK